MDVPVNAKAALLQALISGPGFGLELIERVSRRTGGKVPLHQGSIYPALRDMEREGLVESYERDEATAERGGRPRRYYRLTAKGAKVATDQASIVASLFNLVPEAVR